MRAPAKSEDDIFCELLGKTLNNIPEKDIAKIEIQQKFVSLKHNVNNRNISKPNRSTTHQPFFSPLSTPSFFQPEPASKHLLEHQFYSDG